MAPREIMDGAVAFLKELGRPDLAALLKFSQFRFVDVDIWDEYAAPGVEIVSPAVYSEAMQGLSEDDRRRIAEAIAKSADPPRTRPDHILFQSTKDSNLTPGDRLFPDVLIQQNTMIDVATGGRRIQEVNDYYRARQRRIGAALSDIGLQDPNPHSDLWDWYKKWSADFATYAERRHYVRGLYQPLIDQLLGPQQPAVPPREPTGWERVDRTLERSGQLFSQARNVEDYQAVGLLCREVIISVAQAVYDPSTHKTSDGVTPSATDGGRMIEAFLGSTAAGGANESIRKHARASLQLAVELQHKRTADFRTTALCLEATSSLVNILAILSGRRDPPDE